MLFSVHDDSIDLENLIENRCGRVYSFIERIRKQIFGSSKYELVSIYPEKKNLSIDNYSDSIYLNFDLRLKGLVFYFRYKNTEYVEFCSYNQLSFQTSDNVFTLQTDKYHYKFQIINLKSHYNFLKKLYEHKTSKN